MNKNEFIIDLNDQIKTFEQSNHVVLFDNKRVLKMAEEEIEVIDFLNFSVDPFNIHPMEILSELIPRLEILDDETPEKQFFYKLIEKILNLYVEEKATDVSVVYSS